MAAAAAAAGGAGTARPFSKAQSLSPSGTPRWTASTPCLASRGVIRLRRAARSASAGCVTFGPLSSSRTRPATRWLGCAQFYRREPNRCVVASPSPTLSPLTRPRVAPVASSYPPILRARCSQVEYYFLTPEGDGFKTVQLADAYFYIAVQVSTRAAPAPLPPFARARRAPHTAGPRLRAGD